MAGLILRRAISRDILNETVDYLLFADETPIASPVQPGSAFAKSFSSAGPRDRQGRSLRELDLQTRLFKYRCSYMIYSPAFDALPTEARHCSPGAHAPAAHRSRHAGDPR